MNNLNLDKSLKIAHEEKIKRGLETYIPLYPMLRVVEDKLYVSVMLTAEDDNVWGIDENVKPEYWLLIDIDTVDDVLDVYCFLWSFICKNADIRFIDIYAFNILVINTGKRYKGPLIESNISIEVIKFAKSSTSPLVYV